MAKIYTRTGDEGETSLLGGRRVRKDDLRVEAIGDVDEANAALGMVRAEWRLPMCPMSAGNRDRLRAILVQAGILKV